MNLAKIDCEQWSGVCRAAGIRGYPAIRLYTGVVDGQSQSADGIEINSQHAPSILEMVDLHLSQVAVDERRKVKETTHDEF